MTRTVLLALLLGLFSWPTFAEPVTTIRDNGDPNIRLDLVILGDGYTVDELAKYATDVENVVTSFFAQEPFSEYQSYFNVHRIDVISNESGVDHPETGTLRDTALNSYYNCAGIQRLICTDIGAVNTVLGASVTASQREVVLVLVNDPEYGGSGGAIAVASTHPAVVELVLHELGHSFGLLADEYFSSPPTCNTSIEPAQVNVTLETDRQFIKWNTGGGPPTGWIDSATPIPTAAGSFAGTGLFDGGKYCDPGLGMYRSMDRSKMRSLESPFGEVNEEQLVKRIYTFVSPIDSVQPAPSATTIMSGSSEVITVAVPQPLSNPLDIEWRLDGQVIVAGLSLQLGPTELTPGPRTVTLDVADPTQKVRFDPAGLLTEFREWTFFVATVDDTDGDGVDDVDDAFPTDPFEWLDTDGDGTGNNADDDDDGDQIPDQWEIDNGLDALNAADASADPDVDLLSNLDEFLTGTDPHDSDSDDDTVIDGSDNCPLTPNTEQLDDDGDGIGNVCDLELGTAQFRDPYASIWESQVTVVVNVDRVGPTVAPLTVDYYFEANTAQPGVDYVDDSGSITFAIGESAKTITVYIINDNLFEGYGANTFFVRLSGDNVNPNGNSFPIYVWNDDLLRGQSRFGSDSYYVAENAGSVVIDIERVNGSEADHDFCVYSDNAGTAVVGIDYGEPSRCSSMANGITSDFIIESIFDNDDIDGEKYFDLLLSSAYGTADPSSTRVFILDDEEPVMRTRLQPLPDITSDGIEDLAVVREGSIIVEVRDGANSALQRNIEFFGPGFTPVAAATLPDSDGNAVAELAVLGIRNSDGRMVAEIRNLAGDQAPRKIWFAQNHTPVTIKVIEGDADSNGVVELAVLSTRDSDGRIAVEVKNAFGPTNPNTVWYMSGNTPVDLEVIPDKDANGIPEVAVLSFRNSDGRIVTEVKNAVGPTAPTAVWFMPGNTAIDLVAVDDKDANGIPEVAVLSSRISDGRNVVEIKNASGPTAPTAVWFMAGATATDVAQIHDADSNGVPEVAVLSVRDSDGRIVVEVKNVTGPTSPNTMWYSSGFAAHGLATIADTDANAIEEALVLMIRDSDGRILVQGRNAAGNPAPNQYWFSP